MNVRVEIDPHAGFCGGVIRAIGSAERYLESHPGRPLYSLGSIVHNDEELSRLRAKGLKTISLQDLSTMSPGHGGETLLIRAHGEPPSTYRMVGDLGFEMIDCTCPVVLLIQRRIREAYVPLKACGGSLVIFGKVGHAEVLGLLGQVGGDALVVENAGMIESLSDSGALRYDRPIEIFSQTTMSPDGYAGICDYIRSHMPDPSMLTVHDTICMQVAGRHRMLADFARRHDAVVFVCGKSSSNGAVLGSLCRSANPRTWQIQSASELRGEWFRDGDNIGVSGATSTPKWLLEEVAAVIAGAGDSGSGGGHDLRPVVNVG